MRRFPSVAAAVLPLLLLPASALAQPAPTGDAPADAPGTPAADAAEPGAPEATPDEPGDAPEPPPGATARPPLISTAPPSAAAATVAAQPSVTAATPATSTGTPGSVGEDPDQVYAEDWWHMARPVMELHGYFRMRAELFHNFALGRADSPDAALWAMPPDNSYTSWSSGQVTRHDVPFCGKSADTPSSEFCKDKTQAGANLRFRLNPELHISDNLRIMSQIDLLDNVVMGSTPDGYTNEPSADGGYQRANRSGYTPLSAFNWSMDAPTAGQNSYGNSIVVKRVWGEYLTPVGQLRFGRMPSHWGLGMLANSGDGYDSDYQSTSDRIMFITGIKAIDLYFAGAWDFQGEGATSQSLNDQQGQPYDLSQLDDVNQYVLVLMRRKNPALQRLSLAQGDLVLNGGMYFVYRHQFLANDNTGAASAQYLGADAESVREGYVRRNAKAIIPDLWLQLLYKKFRFEMEAVAVRGSIESTTFTGGTSDYQNTTNPDENGWKIRQYGLATQTEYKTVEDRLRLNFGFGWASGDPDVVGPKAGGLSPGFSGLQPQRTSDRTFSTFRFHPDYRVDMILFRNILNRVQGAYYFKPSVDYDFSRKSNGQTFGGGAGVIWSRASEFVQTPGHKRDLGIEINLNLYFQSKDGSLNDDPDKMGGFYTMLQYGVLFPMGGLGYLPGEEDQAREQGIGLDTSAAQALRWYAGIFF